MNETLETLFNQLEKISNPSINQINIGRDRVGCWRVVITEHFTSLYISKSDESITKAISEVLNQYKETKKYDSCNDYIKHSGDDFNNVGGIIVC